MTDPIVDEVRKVRAEIAEECAQRGETLVEYLRRTQLQWQDRLVRFSPQPLVKKVS